MTDPTDAPARINRRTRTPQDGHVARAGLPLPGKVPRPTDAAPRRGAARTPALLERREERT